jgi:beta-glucanase (GH16 family)
MAFRSSSSATFMGGATETALVRGTKPQVMRLEFDSPPMWNNSARRLLACFVFGQAVLSAPQALAAEVGGATFIEEFSTASLDTAAWVALERADGEAGLQYYSSGHVRVANGIASLLTNANKDSPCCNYTSAAIQSRSFNFTYGTVEFRAKMAGGQGTWPAVWLLGHDCQTSNVTTPANVGRCNWPQPGSDEIDITEVLNSNPTVMNQQIHSSGHNEGCQVQTADSSAAFHTYQLIWLPGSLTWTIDGATTCQVKGSFVPSTPMFVIVQTVVGDMAGVVDDSTLPQTLAIDYLRVTPPSNAAVRTPALPSSGTLLLGALLGLAGCTLIARRAFPAAYW